jgi:hypothetical protein
MLLVDEVLDEVLVIATDIKLRISHERAAV